MGLRVNSSVEAFNTHRALVASNNRIASSMQKLSSGLRINTAADDAAGLGISERMRGQIRGIEQAQRNAQDGISLVQTAEGSMQEMHSIMQRVRELAVQYQNGVNGTQAQAAITAEIAQLSSEISRMVGAASFNGINLLSAPGAVLTTLQVGPNNAASDSLVVPSVTVETAAMKQVFTDFLAGTNMNTIIGRIDTQIDALSTNRATFGAIQNRLEHTVNALGIYQENLMQSESRIRDVDMAQEMTRLTRNQILNESGVAMLTQANQNQRVILQLLTSG